MTWRPARSLRVLLDEVNAVAPRRNKRSDGLKGDPAHAKRKSDHNPNRAGVVCALDLTHDPGGGLDCHDLTERIRQRCGAGDEKRVAYIIWNQRIASARQSWSWRPYNGSNPHDKHAHISVRQDPAYYDDPAPWGFVATPKEDEVTDADLARIQQMINEAMELRDRDHNSKHARELELLEQIAEAVRQ